MCSYLFSGLSERSSARPEAVAPCGAARPERSWRVRTKIDQSVYALMIMSNENDEVYRAISNGKLHTLLRFHTRPINVVVFHGSQGTLVFRLVSRLDAFSGYPFRI